MKKLILLSSLAGALALGSGCVSYTHTAANGDKTSFGSFLVKGEAGKISAQSAYEGTNYTRKVSVGSVAGESEVDKLAGLAEAIARGVATGANPVKVRK